MAQGLSQDGVMQVPARFHASDQRPVFAGLYDQRRGEDKGRFGGAFYERLCGRMSDRIPKNARQFVTIQPLRPSQQHPPVV